MLGGLLLAAEAAYRALSPAGVFYQRTHPGTDEPARRTWARPHERLGWVFSGQNLDTLRGSARKWTASANAEGFRSSYDYGTRGPKDGKIRVMVLGDSFVFGLYLNDSETLTSLLQEELGSRYEVDNFGMSGWGIDQMVLAYREFVDLVSPDIVMVVYIDDDVFRVFESYRGTEAMSKPGFELVDGRLTLRTRDHTGAFERLAQVSIIANRFYKHVYRPRESERVVRAFFVELARETRARGQRLVVVRYPTAGDVLRNWEQVFDFSALFEHEGVTYIDPQDSMRAAGVVNDGLYLPDDAHPGVEGNRFVARYIVRHAALEH